MFCHVCNEDIDRFHTVWLPERMAAGHRVYPLCFPCSDDFIRLYQAGFLGYLQGRELGGSVFLK
jgi:hypothetical protein